MDAFSPTPRSSIDSQNHATVSDSLKSLKAASRQIGDLIALVECEALALQRLYYKGKNQHRISLFWRHVVELKRICKRLSTTNAKYLVDAFRQKFYEQETNALKAAPSAWNHVPSVEGVILFIQRIHSIHELVVKATRATRTAYISFVQQCQNTAFLALTMTLMSTVSRIDAAMPEYQASLELTWSAARQILGLIDKTPMQTRRRIPKALTHVSLNEESEPHTNTFSLLEGPHTQSDEEDLGSSVPQLSPASRTLTTVSIPTQSTPTIVPQSEYLFMSEEQPTTTLYNHLHPPAPRPVIHVATQKAKPKPSSTKVKKPKKNEIDDIFGF
ncbi:hypothetical protein SISNIDRAFT_480845 [Sistotremastrum niveocremeum HHB9708]|uniref:Nucleolus and neural progenitor protein-like N-terminal domain-containing protein n=2 Tax=Sistotremastraceae TaxID=3402574 RepID=A0A165AMK8_9AGAM|nr:hypothetical protein SISNIDRAFT_480845 [Sistotremastrum niveocremeum HHB9708]KZT42114.1 hypothetical protein SISSUDRAFT_1042064 [Sistotremastrum suecicum HHB10207 ss-3]